MDESPPKVEPSTESNNTRSALRTTVLLAGPIIVVSMGVAGLFVTGDWFSKWESIILISGGLGLLTTTFTAWKTQRVIPDDQRWTKQFVIMWLVILMVFMGAGLWLLQDVQKGQPLISRVNGDLDTILPICVAMISFSSKHNFQIGHQGE